MAKVVSPRVSTYLLLTVKDLGPRQVICINSYSKSVAKFDLEYSFIHSFIQLIFIENLHHAQ